MFKQSFKRRYPVHLSGLNEYESLAVLNFHDLILDDKLRIKSIKPAGGGRPGGRPDTRPPADFQPGLSGDF